MVLVEVISDSTGDYDRGQKFELYRSIPTLRDYLLIEQSRVAAEHRQYVSDTEWASRWMTPADDVVRLTGVELELPLSRIYAQVDFKS